MATTTAEETVATSTPSLMGALSSVGQTRLQVLFNAQNRRLSLAVQRLENITKRLETHIPEDLEEVESYEQLSSETKAELAIWMAKETLTTAKTALGQAEGRNATVLLSPDPEFVWQQLKTEYLAVEHALKATQNALELALYNLIIK